MNKKLICILILLNFYIFASSFCNSTQRTINKNGNDGPFGIHPPCTKEIISDNTFEWSKVAQSMLVTCWGNGKLCIVNMLDGNLVQIINLKDYIVPNTQKYISPQGKEMAILNYERNEVLFVFLEEPFMTKKVILANIRALEHRDGFFSSNGIFYCASIDWEYVWALDVKKCEIIWEARYNSSELKIWVNDVTFTNNGKLMLLTGIKEVVVCSIPEVKKINEFVIDDGEFFRCTMDCEHIILCNSKTQSLKKFNILNNQIDWEIKNGGLLEDVSFDGTSFISFNTSTKEITVFDINQGAEISRHKIIYNAVDTNLIPFTQQFVYVPRLQEEKSKSDERENLFYYSRENNTFIIVDALSGKEIKRIEMTKPPVD